MLYSVGPKKKPRDQEGKTHGVLKQSGKVRERTPNSHRLSASIGQCKSYSEGQPDKGVGLQNLALCYQLTVLSNAANLRLMTSRAAGNITHAVFPLHLSTVGHFHLQA